MNVKLGLPVLPMKMSAAKCVTGRSYVLHASSGDMEPTEEQPFDYSRKYNEAHEEAKTNEGEEQLAPDTQSRSESSTTARSSTPPSGNTAVVTAAASSYHEDDVPRVYCTEGTPRQISRASSVGDLGVADAKRRPETIHEHEEVKRASHTATANATPQVWSRCSSPNSLGGYCMNGQQSYDAHSIISEFSRQASGLISPSDLPDSPGQTMPPSPKYRRNLTAGAFSQQATSKATSHHASAEHANLVQQASKFPHYSYAQNQVQSQNGLTQEAQFSPINNQRVNCNPPKDSQGTSIRQAPGPRQIQPYKESKIVGESYTQEDSLHNYRTEDTPANLSAATSFSDLSSICPKSDHSAPVAKPRRRKQMTPLPGNSPTMQLGPPLEQQGHTLLIAAKSVQDGPVPPASAQVDDSAEKKCAEAPSWKPKTLPRKVWPTSTVQTLESSASPFAENTDRTAEKACLNSPSNPDSDSNSEDEELLRQVITKGRPGRLGDSCSGTNGNTTSISTSGKPILGNTQNEASSDSDSDNQEILDELIKLGRPASRNQMALLKSIGDSSSREDREGDHVAATKVTNEKSKQDRFKGARSMENLISANSTKTIKKGSTNFHIREQPLRGSDMSSSIRSNIVIARAQSLKGSKSLGYDQLHHERRQAKTPELRDFSRFDISLPEKVIFNAKSSNSGFQKKPVSKVSPMRPQAQPSTSAGSVQPLKKTSLSRSSNGYCNSETDSQISNEVLLSPLRSSVRQSRQTALKKTTVLNQSCSEDDVPPFPPLPPKPAHLRTVAKTTAEYTHEETPPLLAATIATVGHIHSSDLQVAQASSVVQLTTNSVSSRLPGDHCKPSLSTPCLTYNEENNNVHCENDAGKKLVAATEVSTRFEIPPEPPEDGGDITVLNFKFTDSNRNYTRRFLKDNKFAFVVHYLGNKGFPPEKYKVVVPGVFRLKKEISQDCYEKTLSELKMFPKKTLLVKPR